MLQCVVVAAPGSHRHPEEEVTARRGRAADSDGEAGEPGHDQGGDLGPLLRQEGGDQAPAGGGGEVPGQPRPLHPQPSYPGESVLPPENVPK